MIKNTTYKLAESLSLVLNPFLLLPIVFLIALFLTPFKDQVSQTRWLGVVFMSNFIIPLWLIFYLDQQGVVLDDTLANKELHRSRLIALLPISGILLLEIFAMFFWHVQKPLFDTIVSGFVITLFGGFISYYWKISAHALGLSTTITLLVVLLGPWALFGAIAIPGLIWSRIVLHRHTPWQLAVGTILPPIIIGIVVWILR